MDGITSGDLLLRLTLAFVASSTVALLMGNAGFLIRYFASPEGLKERRRSADVLRVLLGLMTANVVLPVAWLALCRSDTAHGYFAISKTTYLSAVGTLCVFNVAANLLLWFIYRDHRRKSESYAAVKSDDEEARRPNNICRRHSASPSHRKSRSYSHLLPPPCPPRPASCAKFRDLPHRAMSAPVVPQREGPSSAAEVQALFEKSREASPERQAEGMNNIDRSDSMAWILDDRSPERMPKRRSPDLRGFLDGEVLSIASNSGRTTALSPAPPACSVQHQQQLASLRRAVAALPRPASPSMLLSTAPERSALTTISEGCSGAVSPEAAGSMAGEVCQLSAADFRALLTVGASEARGGPATLLEAGGGNSLDYDLDAILQMSVTGVLGDECRSPQYGDPPVMRSPFATECAA